MMSSGISNRRFDRRGDTQRGQLDGILRRIRHNLVGMVHRHTYRSNPSRTCSGSRNHKFTRNGSKNTMQSSERPKDGLTPRAAHYITLQLAWHYFVGYQECPPKLYLSS